MIGTKSVVKGLLFVLVVLAVFVLPSQVFAQSSAEVSASKSSQSAETASDVPTVDDLSTVGKTSFPRCVGGDLEKLQGTTIRKCLKYKDLFEEYALKNGLDQLGIDTLALFVLAERESGCKSLAGGDANAPKGGIMQVDRPCYYNPEQCPTSAVEIDMGTKELFDKASAVQDFSGLSGRQLLWMLWFSYNRGQGAAKKASSFMIDKGMSIADATHDACSYYYSNKDSFNCAASSQSGTRSNYDCPDGEKNPVCANGETCAFNFYCRIKYPDVGVHYSDILWTNYVKHCENIGGTIVDEGALSEASGATSSQSSSDASVSISTSGSSAGYVPSHPYFDVPYSIDPSFRVEGDFDFSLYEAVPPVLRSLERCRDDLDCILSNVSALEVQYPVYDWVVKYGGNVVSSDADGNSELPDWLAFCEDPSLNAATSLAEALDAAERSGDSDCVVKYDLPVFVADESFIAGLIESSTRTLLGLASFGVSELLLSLEDDSRTIALLQAGKDLKVFVRGDNVVDPHTQFLEGVEIGSISPALRGDYENELVYSLVEPATLDIYKDVNGTLHVYPEGGAPTTSVCSAFNKVLKFCVVENRSTLAYDDGANALGIQRLALRLAYTFKSEVTAVTGVEVLDAPYSAGKSIIVWDRLEGVDVDKYTIYVSENSGLSSSLFSVLPSELRQDTAILGEFDVIDLPVEGVEEIFSVDLYQEPLCEAGSLSPFTCALEYSVETASSDGLVERTFVDRTTYFDAEHKRYFYFLPGLEDGHRYFVAVTATDSDGEESPAFSVVDDEFYESPSADAPPGVVSVRSAHVLNSTVVITTDSLDYHIDGSVMDPADVVHFKIFCSASDDDIDLFTYPSFFESSFGMVGDGSMEIVADALDFNSYNCGYSALPAEVNVVVVGVARDGIQDVYYKGSISPLLVSEDSLVLPSG